MITTSFIFYCYRDHPDLHSFPTRRSSDLPGTPHHGDLDRRIPTTAGRLRAQGTFLRHLRSEEHTSELQSRGHLVCRLLLEKKKTNTWTGQTRNRYLT